MALCHGIETADRVEPQPAGAADFQSEAMPPASGLRRGAYVLAEADKGAPDVILIAHWKRSRALHDARDQSGERRHPRAPGQHAELGTVRGTGTILIAIRFYHRPFAPASPLKRHRHLAGSAMSDAMVRKSRMTTFGASGPYKDVYRHFAITAEHIVETAKEQVARNKGG